MDAHEILADIDAAAPAELLYLAQRLLLLSGIAKDEARIKELQVRSSDKRQLVFSKYPWPERRKGESTTAPESTLPLPEVLPNSGKKACY